MSLQVDNIHSYYGKSHILQGVSLNVPEGSVVTLLGRNGAGKSTTLKTIAGVIAPKAGSIRLQSRDIAGQPAHKIAAMGVCLVPEHRGIFKLLTVEENLKLGARRQSPWQLEDMLAIGRALMNHPRLLMLDEPVEGLAPVIVEEIVAQIKLIKQAGVTILLVEQNLEVCTQLADHHFIIEQGAIVYEGTNAAFLADDAIKDRYLGVGV
jgi:branched-chain amino acid transport system ATP-binding protein